MPKIIFLLSAPDAQAMDRGQLLSYAVYKMIVDFCDMAGIKKGEYDFLTVLPEPLPGGRLDSICVEGSANGVIGYPALFPKKFVHESLMGALAATREKLDELDPNIVVPLGQFPLWFMAKTPMIKKQRGTLQMCSRSKHKILPTWEPSSIFSKYDLFPIVYLDFKKIARHKETKDFSRPSRKIWLSPTIADLYAFDELYIEPASLVACDIETKRGHITEVGFSPNPHIALVIPFYQRSAPDGNYWKSQAEEIEAWNFVRRILQTKTIVGQNFQYDTQWFWKVMGIPATGFTHDTMLLHHALQPEMEKSLGFMGSLYTDEPQWKTMRTDAETLKKQD